MPFTNSTPNYGLPQYIATDKPTYLGDANGAYSTIDTRMKANANAAAENANSITLLSARVLENEGNISTNTDSITALNTAVDGWVGSQIIPAAAFSASPAVGFRSNKKLGLLRLSGYLTKGNSAITSGETLFVLPEGHRPRTTIYIRGGCFANGATSSGLGVITISASGIVAISGIVYAGGDGIMNNLYLDINTVTAGWGTGFPPLSEI